MAGILHPYLMGAGQGLLAPPTPAAPMAQQSGGLLSMFMPEVGQNKFYQGFDRNRDTLTNAFFGMVGQDGPRGAARGFAQGAQYGRESDRVLAEQRRKEAEAQRTKNSTIEWLTKSRPDLAEAVAAGMPIGEAFNQAFAQQKSTATDDMREYEFARQQGYEGTFRDFMTEMKKAGSTQVTQIAGQSNTFRDTVDKKSAEMFSGLMDSGYQAQRSKVQIERLAGLLEQVPTGGGAAMRQIAGNFGIATEGLDEIQAAQAIINQLVPQQRPPGSGPMSDADLELFKQSLPRIVNQPGGNQIIIETMMGIAEYTEMQGRIAQAVVNGEISTQEGTRLLNQLPNPLERIKTGSTQPATSPDEYARRYGLEPR